MTRARSVMIVLAATHAALPARPAPVPPVPGAEMLAAHAAKRFPQPVRVGDLIGRDVLEPIEAQPVLGHVAGISRGPDGLAMIVRLVGPLGLGSRPVAVPVDAVALLGEHVAVIDLSPAQLADLPTAADAAGLGPDETIRVGLVRPFH